MLATLQPYGLLGSQPMNKLASTQMHRLIIQKGIYTWRALDRFTTRLVELMRETKIYVKDQAARNRVCLYPLLSLI